MVQFGIRKKSHNAEKNKTKFSDNEKSSKNYGVQKWHPLEAPEIGF